MRDLSTVPMVRGVWLRRSRERFLLPSDAGSATPRDPQAGSGWWPCGLFGPVDVNTVHITYQLHAMLGYRWLWSPVALHQLGLVCLVSALHRTLLACRGRSCWLADKLQGGRRSPRHFLVDACFSCMALNVAHKRSGNQASRSGADRQSPLSVDLFACPRLRIPMLG